MSWTRTSDRGQGCPCTRLRFESLEERSLLAVAAFQINLYEDVGGAPGELITDDAVEPDDTFFVEITAREYDPDASGLGGVALDIAWDPDSLEEIDDNLAETITENLPSLQRRHTRQRGGHDHQPARRSLSGIRCRPSRLAT